MPLGQVDKLAKLVPQNPAKPVTLKQAIESEARLQEAAAAEPKVARLLEISQTLEGLYSNASTHAAGIVIGDRPLDELVPLYRDPKSDMPATQFNMKWVEPAGLVKFDFLGLKTLTTLSTAIPRCASSFTAVASVVRVLSPRKSNFTSPAGSTHFMLNWVAGMSDFGSR